MINLNSNERYELVTRNTEDIMTNEELKQLLEEKEHPSAYIGLAPTGMIHLGYFVPITKIGDLLKAGFQFKILLADIHAHLDDRKTPFDLLAQRVEVYRLAMTSMLKAMKIDTSNLSFVKGSDFQLAKEYTLDMYKLAALNTFDRCKRAASEVVRFGDAPKLSGFIYPIMQALDEQYLDVDMQYGGVDQRKILAFARESMPKLDYKVRVELMTPMVPGLQGTKMSASDTKSKIDVIESPESIKKKLNKAFCPEGEVENNGVLAFMKHVIMIYKQDNNEKFIIERPEKFGGNAQYSNYEDLERDFVDKKLHPQDLKAALANELNILLEPVREAFRDQKELLLKAFPDRDFEEMN